MKDMNEKMSEFLYGEDYSQRMEDFEAKMKEVRENYDGDYDTTRPLFTMLPHQANGTIRIIIDDDVPQDLSDSIMRGFESAWK